MKDNDKLLIDEAYFNNIYVFSDIHGYINLFNNLLKKINLKRDDLLIVAGDSCDRGEKSYAVYEKMINLQKKGYNLIHLLGNHEKMFYDYFLFGEGYKLWMLNHGEKTLKYYNNHKILLNRHLDFIEKMPLLIETQNYILVHAGINPNKRLDEQEDRDLLWIREKFINKELKYVKKTVVFGHSVTSTGRIYFYPNNTIGIDCGSYLYHKLGALELKSKREFYTK